MKLYSTPPPMTIIRLQITQQGKATEYISLQDTTQGQVIEWTKKLIIDNCTTDPFDTGRKTSVNIRHFLGGKAGKSVSISFRGMTPEQTKALIIKNLQP